MLDDFIVRALLAAAASVCVAAPLGCFLVWRRMAYFGDTLSHSALTGVALGIVAGVSPMAGVVVVGLIIAGSLVFLQDRARIADDTVLGILSHSALAVGLIVVSFLDTVRVDLLGYLFGDILAVSPRDIAWIGGGGLFVLAALLALWRPLIALTVNSDMAAAEGIPVQRVRLVFTLLIAVTVALAMKIIGVLLITALLLLPPAAARRFSRNPEAMAALSILAGWLAVAMGLAGSFRWDTPAGPSIIVAAALLFALTLVLPRRA